MNTASERSTAGESALHLAVAGEHRQACELLLRSTDMQLTGHTARNDSGLSPMETCGATFRTEVERINRSVRESFAAFISHAKADAALEARFLKEELQARLDGRHGRNVFLDSDHLRNLRSLEQHVRDSDVLVVVQSANFLTRPYCLLELLFAIETETPIVGVCLSGGPSAYDFAGAATLLTNLDSQLEPRAPECVQVLRENKVDLLDAAWKLGSTIPHAISVSLNTSASRNVLAATMEDIMEAIRQAKPLKPPLTKDEWLRRRTTPAYRGDSSSTRAASRWQSSHQIVSAVSRLAHTPASPTAPDE